jgi:hypothetical protein
MAGGVEGLVGLGLGEAGVAEPLEELGLPFVAGPLGRAAGGAPQQAASAVPVGSGDRGLDGAVVVHAQPLGLGDRALEFAVARHRRDIEQRAVERGGRDALIRRGVLGIEGACAVQADPRGAVAAAGRGDVDACLVGPEQAPVGGRRAMREHRAGPAGQHRRQPVALCAQCGVSEGVDAAVEQLQAPHRQPMLHRTARQAHGEQLRARNHPPLPRRDPRDPGERGWARLTRIIRFKRAHPPRVAGDLRQ